MRRLFIVCLIVALLLTLLLPPLLIAQGIPQPLVNVRAASSLALLWGIGSLLATLYAALRFGWEAARARQTGRWRWRSTFALLGLMALCWLLIPAMDQGDNLIRPPLITLTSYASEPLWGLFVVVGAWLLAALVGGYVLAAGRARRKRDARLQTLVTEGLAEGVALLDPRLRVRFANEIADRQIIKGDSVEAGVAQLVRRARDMGKVAAQSMTVDEGRVTVQALPLPDGDIGIVTRPQSNENSATEFYERFMRRIVHDMRNPLAAIIAHASNLRTAPDFDRANADRTAQTIENEAQRLTRLVDSILFDARLSHLPLVLEAIDLADIIEEVYYQHDERAEREGKTLEFEAPPTPLTLDGDRDLLVRAVSNLVDNSLKYSPIGSRVRIVGERTNAHVVVKVIDDGEGIPPEYLPDRVFEAMVRVKPRDGIFGSGLGLSIVKKIAQMHGGAVSAESTLGRGTTMTLVLPLRE